MRERQNIAVVGCGVAGATSAVLLARQGHRVTLFEQASAIQPVGAGLLLQPSGQRVLARMGLLQEAIGNAEPIEKLVAVSHRGRKISRLLYGDHFDGCLAYGVHRADLFEVLHRNVLDAGITIRLGRAIERVDFARDRVVATDLFGDQHGPFDLLIAADGQRSRIRQSLDPQRLEFEYDAAALWGLGQCDTIRGQLFQMTRGTSQLIGLLPTGLGRCSFFWGIQRSQLESIRQRGFDALLDEVTILCPQARSTLQSIGRMEALSVATYRCVLLRRAYVERCAFVGDAAHASSPHLGQGVNLALLDAERLSDAIAQSESLEDALAIYDSKRRWPNVWYSTLSAALTPTFQSSVPLLGTARDLCLPWMQRVGPLRRLMLSTLTGVKR